MRWGFEALVLSEGKWEASLNTNPNHQLRRKHSPRPPLAPKVFQLAVVLLPFVVVSCFYFCPPQIGGCGGNFLVRGIGVRIPPMLIADEDCKSVLLLGVLGGTPLNQPGFLLRLAKVDLAFGHKQGNPKTESSYMETWTEACGSPAG